MITYVAWVVGLIAGLACAVTLVVLWTFLAGPIQEWLIENLVDRFLRREDPEPHATEGAWVAVVSDLHLDTWDGPERPAQFKAFLEALRDDPRVVALYINGDTLDLPPHPKKQQDPGTLAFNPRSGLVTGDAVPGFWREDYAGFLAAAGHALDRPGNDLKLLLTLGNHDIGIAGLRFARKDSPLPIEAIWTPSYLHEGTHQTVFVDHGHRYDPFLWLYLRTALMELVRGPQIRGGPRTTTVGMNPDARARRTPIVPDLEPQKRWDKALLAPRPGFIVWINRLRFRHAARRDLILMRRRHPNLRGLVCGHTHIPDRYVFPRLGVYANSGDWAGDTMHASYLLIAPCGTVLGPFQWSGSLAA